MATPGGPRDEPEVVIRLRLRQSEHAALAAMAAQLRAPTSTAGSTSFAAANTSSWEAREWDPRAILPPRPAPVVPRADPERRRYFQQIGAKGGASKSPAKIAAARANGQRGGRTRIERDRGEANARRL